MRSVVPWIVSTVLLLGCSASLTWSAVACGELHTRSVLLGAGAVVVLAVAFPTGMRVRSECRYQQRVARRLKELQHMGSSIDAQD